MPFSGRAIYDTDGTNTVWRGISEDVSDIITMISPRETPLLNALGNAPRPAISVLHEWLEDELTPDTITSSGTLINSTNELVLPVHSRGIGVGNFLQVGAVLKNNTTGEYMQITAAAGNTITVSRAFGGTTIATVLAGQSFTVIAPAALEGADVSKDVSRIPSRKSNYLQLFKQDIIVSGTMQAVSNIVTSDMFEYQKQNRAAELLRDLEKAVILGKLSGNTIGSSSAYRTMKGMWDFISTNSTSIATLTSAVLDDVIQNAWSYGGGDLDLIVADPTWKRAIDGFNSSRIDVSNGDDRFFQRVTRYAGSFAELPVIMSRYMPTKSVMVISTKRCRVVPLQNRSFQFSEVSRTGDALKGMIVGEYTLECRAEQGMAKAYG